MVSNQQETEVKIYVRNLAELQQHLQTIGAELVQERVFERNIRYDDQYDTLTDKGVVLRLRHDIITRLTYKAPGIIERGIMTREELEVEVSNFDTMEQIIFRLGYSPAMMYEKYRTTYQVGETEVMLDELPYGNFIEIEGDASAIEQTLKKLGLEHTERRMHSYAKLFDFVKHHLELGFRDLTFENFQDIEVPESAFIPPGSIVVG